MKKIMIVALSMFVLIITLQLAHATDWHTANQVTIAWDQSYDIEGGTIPTDQVTWDVFVANAITDPDKTNPVKVGSATENEYTLTLNTEGKYTVGVQAVRTVEGEVLKSSTITWSDEDPSPFGIKYFIIPANPNNLRIK